MDTTPSGGEILDFEPASLPPDFLAALGLMSASAASTDSIIEMAIAGMLGIDGEQGFAVTSHMSAPLRTSVLKAAAEIRFSNPKLLDELDNILDQIQKATADRNAMIHGSWCIRPSNGDVLLVQQQARTHVNISTTPVTISEVKRKAEALYEAGINLMRFIIAIDAVPALPRDRPRGINTPQARKAARSKRVNGALS